jgi:RNA polymerase sigma-70 factor (ECF subfamily)
MGTAPDSSRHESCDPSAWLDQHGDALFRYALLHLGDRTAAEDAVQDTLLAALTARERFTGRSSERTWLIGILKHKIVDRVREATRERPLADLDATAELVAGCFDQRGKWSPGPRRWSSGSDEPFQQREFWDIFRFCASRLPPSLSGAFLLREMAEMATEEICKLLSVTATNLWTMLHRARTRLRECLEVNWFGRKS